MSRITYFQSGIEDFEVNSSFSSYQILIRTFSEFHSKCFIDLNQFPDEKSIWDFFRYKESELGEFIYLYCKNLYKYSTRNLKGESSLISMRLTNLVLKRIKRYIKTDNIELKFSLIRDEVDFLISDMISHKFYAGQIRSILK